MTTSRFLAIVLIPCTLGAQSMPPLGSDSLALRFKDLPEGYETRSLERTPTGYRYVERTVLRPFMERWVRAELDSALRVTRVVTNGVIGGRDVRSDVSYDGAHATGRTLPMQSAAGREIAVDTILPRRAFDGSAFYPITLSRAWKVGAVDTLTIFDTDELTITRQTLRVVSAETLTLPAGRVRALKMELTTTQLPLTLWISEARPHRLLRVSSANGETILIR